MHFHYTNQPMQKYFQTDRCPTHVFDSTMESVQNMLKSADIGLRPLKIRTDDDVIFAVKYASSFTPVLPISAVSGDGLDKLHRLLRSLPQRRKHKKKINRPFEFLVEDIFNLNGVGIVVSGFVNRGQIQVGETIHIGPLRDGSDLAATVKSIEVARSSVNEAWAGHTACFALSMSDRKRQKMLLRKGMVAIKDRPVPTYRKLTAEVCLLRGRTVTVVKDSYEATLHVLHMKLPARVVDIVKHGDSTSSTEIRQGGRATITFEFSQRPCFVRKGMKIILRDGHARGFGVILSVQS
mmetsp:Transcript_22494/g.63741  ORF Transcript_22494/g.63741 Transcript_22494/m.63741 type:complete len:294 (-) Transcript_22494:25-906(-)